MSDEDPQPLYPEDGPMPCRKCGTMTMPRSRIVIFHLPEGTVESECPDCYFHGEML